MSRVHSERVIACLATHVVLEHILCCLLDQLICDAMSRVQCASLW